MQDGGPGPSYLPVCSVEIDSEVRQVRSTVKVVRRKQRSEPVIEPELKQTPEQAARKMVVNVKRWVTELKERKATLMY